MRLLGPAEAPVFRLKGYYPLSLPVAIAQRRGVLHQLLRGAAGGAGAGGRRVYAGCRSVQHVIKLERMNRPATRGGPATKPTTTPQYTESQLRRDRSSIQRVARMLNVTRLSSADFDKHHERGCLSTLAINLAPGIAVEQGPDWSRLSLGEAIAARRSPPRSYWRKLSGFIEDRRKTPTECEDGAVWPVRSETVHGTLGLLGTAAAKSIRRHSQPGLPGSHRGGGIIPMGFDMCFVLPPKDLPADYEPCYEEMPRWYQLTFSGRCLRWSPS